MPFRVRFDAGQDARAMSQHDEQERERRSTRGWRERWFVEASADGGASSSSSSSWRGCCWLSSAALMVMLVENRRGLSLAAWLLLALFLLLCSAGVPSMLVSPAIAPAAAASVTAREAADLRDEVRLRPGFGLGWICVSGSGISTFFRSFACKLCECVMASMILVMCEFFSLAFGFSIIGRFMILCLSCEICLTWLASERASELP